MKFFEEGAGEMMLSIIIVALKSGRLILSCTIQNELIYKERKLKHSLRIPAKRYKNFLFGFLFSNIYLRESLQENILHF